MNRDEKLLWEAYIKEDHGDMREDEAGGELGQDPTIGQQSGDEWEDTPDRFGTSQAEALVNFMGMLSTPEDSSIGDVQDAAQEAIQTGIDKDLIGGILHLPKFELDSDEIDIILNPTDHRPMR